MLPMATFCKMFQQVGCNPGHYPNHSTTARERMSFSSTFKNVPQLGFYTHLLIGTRQLGFLQDRTDQPLVEQGKSLVPFH